MDQFAGAVGYTVLILAGIFFVVNFIETGKERRANKAFLDKEERIKDDILNGH